MASTTTRDTVLQPFGARPTHRYPFGVLPAIGGPVLSQPCGSAANSRLTCRYHPMPEIGLFHLPFMSFKALS